MGDERHLHGSMTHHTLNVIRSFILEACQMNLEEKAAAFLEQKRIAVVGVSRKAGTGNAIMGRFRSRGYTVFPVNPNAEEIAGEKCYPNLKAIPDGVDAVMIVTRPEVTEQVVHECAEAGVSHVWMHYNALFGAGNSSVSQPAVEFCHEHGINVISGACPLMFGQTADFGHKCMRWMLGVTGKLPNGSN
jgi:predicted CoA-binding protein